MEAVPDTFEHPVNAAEFKRPPHRPGVELYRAHIVRHAFEPHTHQAFGLGAIEAGVERFRYRGAEHLAAPSRRRCTAWCSSMPPASSPTPRPALAPSCLVSSRTSSTPSSSAASWPMAS